MCLMLLYRTKTSSGRSSLKLYLPLSNSSVGLSWKNESPFYLQVKCIFKLTIGYANQLLYLQALSNGHGSNDVVLQLTVSNLRR